MLADFKLNENLKPRFFNLEVEKKIEIQCENSQNGLRLKTDKIKAELVFEKSGRDFFYDVCIQNISDEKYSPESLCLDLGVDTYIEGYPEWNDKLFPTFVRCEKTHAYGYFMGPLGNVLAFCTDNPVASYFIDYNYILKDWNYGHRIHGLSLCLINALPLPKHHPQDMYAFLPGSRKNGT